MPIADIQPKVELIGPSGLTLLQLANAAAAREETDLEDTIALEETGTYFLKVSDSSGRNTDIDTEYTVSFQLEQDQDPMSPMTNPSTRPRSARVSAATHGPTGLNLREPLGRAETSTGSSYLSVDATPDCLKPRSCTTQQGFRRTLSEASRPRSRWCDYMQSPRLKAPAKTMKHVGSLTNDARAHGIAPVTGTIVMAVGAPA